VLHTDASVLPIRRLARACWNSLIPGNQTEAATLTYNMNLLQSLRTKRIYNVTLNFTEKIARNTILKEMVYHHPVFTSEGIRCQTQKELISGKRNTYYCGAYWGYGFHEDGVNSALEVCQHFGIEL
jgi:predicted NAD/FAD-binding protein